MNSGIYQITNVVNGKKYVGSSINVKRRRNGHWSTLKKGKHGNSHLQRSWTQYGSGAFHFMVLEYCDIDKLIEREDYWIGLLDTMNPDKGYNLLSANRQETSEETRRKISVASKGRVLGPMSEETRLKLSAAHLGKIQDPESVSKRVASRKGYQHSEETKAKIGNANRGKRQSEEVKEAHSQYNKKMGIIPPSRKGSKMTEEQKAKISEGVRRASFEKWKEERHKKEEPGSGTAN